MPPSSKGSRENPLAKPQGQRTPRPSTLDKQAAVFAAEQNLKPWELPQGKNAGKGKQQKPPAPLDTRYKAAIAAPVNAPVKVGNKKVPSRQYLAQTETPKRRQQYERIIAPPVPKPDTSFLHALLATPGSIAHNLGLYGHDAGAVAQHALLAPPEALARRAIGSAYQANQPGRPNPARLPSSVQGALAGGEAATHAGALLTKSLVGPALFNAVTKGETNHLGPAALELAGLLPFGRPIAGSRAVIDALRALPEGRDAAAAAFRSRLGPSIAETIGAAQTREQSIRNAADQVQMWQRANPHADTALSKEVMGQIATHQGVDEYGLRRFLATGKVPRASTSGEEFSQGLQSAKIVRDKQEAGYSEARASRFALGERAFQEAGGGIVGYQAKLDELRGELPKIHWGRFEHLDTESVTQMLNDIEAHPQLRQGNKITAQGAIMNALQGKVPTKGEITLLEKVFPKHTVDALRGSASTFLKAKNAGVELVNVPRALMASFDLSAPFRQGLMIATHHPVVFFKNFRTMVKAGKSQAYYDGVERWITEHPKYDQAVNDGLSLTDFESGLPHEEEQWIGRNFAEKITGGRYSPVRFSSRAYVAFLNKTRMDVYDMLTQHALDSGLNLNAPSRSILTRHGATLSHANETIGGSIARFVNSATGRGDVGPLTDHIATMNALLFSPRLLASRINFLSPVYYLSLDPFARRQALKAARNLVGTVGLFLYAAKLGGAKVGMDPRSADFAKIKVGNTRFDILGGFQQPIRLLAQLFSGTVISSTTGLPLHLGPEGPGNLSQRDILQRFFEAKLAPIPSLLNDWLKGTDFQGNTFSWRKAMVQRMTPLLAQDAVDLYRDQKGPNGFDPAALGKAAGGYGIGAFGIGLQTYAPKKPKAVNSGPSNPLAKTSSSAGSSNPLSGQGSAGSSNPLAP